MFYIKAFNMSPLLIVLIMKMYILIKHIYMICFTKFIVILLYMSSSLLMQSQNNTMNWDFSNFSNLTFSYQQVMTNKEWLGLDDVEPIKSYSEISGLLMIEVKNKNSADVILKNAKITTFIKDSLGNRLDTRRQAIPDLVYIEGLKENGSVEGTYNKHTELFAKILFPIINQSATGCIIQMPLISPFDVEGDLVEIKGRNTIDFTSISTELFKLKTHIYAKKDNIQSVNDKYYICEIDGESSFDFNPQKRYFTNGNIKLNMLLQQKNDKYNKTKTLVDMDVEITLALIKVD